MIDEFIYILYYVSLVILANLINKIKMNKLDDMFENLSTKNGTSTVFYGMDVSFVNEKNSEIKNICGVYCKICKRILPTWDEFINKHKVPCDDKYKDKNGKIVSDCYFYRYVY